MSDVQEHTAQLFTPRDKQRRAHSLPRLSATFVSSVEDFHVEEIPAYEPCGAGDHAFLWLEKTNLPADSLLGHVGRTLDVPRRDIGYAGLKDTRAITLQFVSVPRQAMAAKAADFDACAELLQTPQVRLVRGDYHRNKLRVGHLRGNRFTITLRGAAPEDLARAQAIAAELTRAGMPNYYGTQRFGRDGSTLRHGLKLLEGAGPVKHARGSKGARQAWLDKLALSAVQSALFNDYLSLRAAQGMRDTVMAGDVLQKRDSGGLFVTEDVAVDQARFVAGEIVPAGPMFGPDMKPATDAVAALEAQVLSHGGLSAEAFTLHKRLTQGTRRATLVWPEDLQVEASEGASLRLAFSLPSGSYATEVIAEFIDLPAAHGAAASPPEVAA